MRSIQKRLPIVSFLIALGTLLPAISVRADDVAPLKFDEEALPRDLKPTDVIHWRAISGEADPEGRILLGLRLSTQHGFTLYQNKMSFTPPPGYLIETTRGPAAQVIDDPISGSPVEVYAGGDFDLVLKGAEPFTSSTLSLSVTYIGCTTRICLFPHTEDIRFTVYPVAKLTLPGATAEPAPAAALASQVVTEREEEDLQSQLSTLMTAADTSFLLILMIAFVGGLLTNLTPCVMPMIPITVRVLSAQVSSPFLSSSLYAAGIVTTYTGLGMAAAMSGGVFGQLLQSTAFNVTFAVIMSIMALTMLGFGNWAFLQNIGSRIGSTKPSAWNAFLMGAGAGLVAAPCTGPILATLLTYTAQTQEISTSAGLLFTYSLGFGLPYVFLGGTAAHVSRIRVPYPVMIAVKFLFASVMFALALYFLRIPLYRWLQQFDDVWPMIATVGLSVGTLCIALWIWVPRLESLKATSIIPALILAFGFFGAYKWLTAAPKSLVWQTSEASAIAAASEQGLPILVDGWAEWCEACKEMDRTTFADPRVIAELKENWIILKLDLTETDEVADMLTEKYGLQSLPTLVMLKSSGDPTQASSIRGYVGAGTLLNRLREFRAEN